MAEKSIAWSAAAPVITLAPPVLGYAYFGWKGLMVGLLLAPFAAPIVGGAIVYGYLAMGGK